VKPFTEKHRTLPGGTDNTPGREPTTAQRIHVLLAKLGWRWMQEFAMWAEGSFGCGPLVAAHRHRNVIVGRLEAELERRARWAPRPASGANPRRRHPAGA